jgi:geranylgeranyl diphosphate synthase type I
MDPNIFSHPLIKEILAEIEDYCKLAIDRNFNDTTQPLREMLNYHMGWIDDSLGKKGKRIRPLLVCLVNHISGGDWKEALPAAAAIELIHNFSLIHDDIQDKSVTRHGRETLWVKHGMAQSINAGDAIFSLALNEIWNLQESFSTNTVSQCSRLLTETCLKLTEGQYLDISFENRLSVTQEEYLEMIKGKTTALISTCTRIGALLGTNDQKRIDGFRLYGEYLGLAFQIVDDYLGVWGNDAITGKSTSSDLVTGKMSYPIIIALEANEQFRDSWSRRNTQPEEVPEILKLLEEFGIANLTISKADAYTKYALNNLESAAADQAEYHILKELTLWLLKRNL